MKVLEIKNDQLENAFTTSLTSAEMADLNGGWCFILFCTINFSMFLAPVTSREEMIMC